MECAQKGGASVKPLRDIPQFFERDAPNALWQTDLLEDEPTAIGNVHGVFYLDDHSRCCVGGAFYLDKGEEGVLLTGMEAALKYGLPQELLSDNGSQFQVVNEAARASGTKTRYQAGWESLGATVTFAAPHHPQTKGKEERFNRFVNEDFLNEVRDKVKSEQDLNERFQQWRQYYNEKWRHSSLNFQPPASRYREGMKVDAATLWAAFAKEESRTARLDGKIQVDNKLYQLPNGWEKARVRVYRLGNRLKAVGGKENRLLGEWTL